MLGKFLCMLGVHKFSLKDSTYKHLGGGKTAFVRGRKCRRCGKSKFLGGK